MGRHKIFFLSLFCLLSPLIVTVVSDSVSLYPSESIVAPFGSTVSVDCSFSFTLQLGTVLVWNISKVILQFSSPDRGITIEPPVALVGVSKLSVVVNSNNSDLDIQCQSCPSGCNFNLPEDYSASTDPIKVIAFGELQTII